jgi:adenosylhomocysteine nucleosidase
MKILLAVALGDELDERLLPEDWAVVYTGVGKVNAAMKVCAAIGMFDPDIIINYGTAGAISDVSGLLEVRGLVQRDMVTPGLSERGMTPGEPKAVITCLNDSTNIICGTGDSFVTEHDPWLVQTGVDIVDMEAYAIAKVADLVGIPFRCWKYVSDNADSSAPEAWEENVSAGQTQFLQDIVYGELSSVRRRPH